MMNSISLGADGQANYSLAVLRKKRKKNAALRSKIKFHPGFRLLADPGLGLTGTYSSPPGRLLELRAHMTGAGDWVGLHVDLPAGDLGPFGVLGFAARVSARELQVAHVCLRSGTATGFEDHFFDKHILMAPEEACHVDILSIHQRDGLPLTARWRQLVMFLPTQDFELSLIDLRFFIV